MPGVDTHQGDVSLAGDLEGTQDRAVTAEDEDEVDVVGALRTDGFDAVGAQSRRGPGHGGGRGRTGSGDGDRFVVEVTLQQHDARNPLVVRIRRLSRTGGA